MRNRCDRCGQERGADGVTTVLLERSKDGRIDAILVRECQACASQAAKDEANG